MSRNSAELRRLRELLSLAYDNQLTERDRTELRQLLTQHPDLIADYCFHVAIETGLRADRTQQHLESLRGKPENRTNRSGLSSCAPSETRNLIEKSPRAAQIEAARPRRRWWAQVRWPFANRWYHPALAVGFAVIAVLGWRIWHGPAATIAALADPIWRDGVHREVGQPVERQWLELSEGAVEIAFRDGARSTWRAPCRFRVDAAGRASLKQGAVSIYTPPAASGFAIRTDDFTVVDRGTAFQLVVPAEGRAAVHVTQGHVDIESQGQRPPLTLQTGQIARCGDGDKPTLVDPQSLLPKTRGALRSLHEHPSSLGLNRFDHDDQMFVFLERYAFPLEHEMRVDITEPGDHRAFGIKPSVLPAGTLVSCFLIHFSPQSPRQVVSGRALFSGRVLGVITDSDRLNGTNATFGSSLTLACQHPQRGLESAPNRNSDVVTLSEDRRTLAITLRTEAIDQMRVLVAAD